MLTLQERFGTLSGLKLAYLGDGNNVATSLILAGAAMGVSVTVASPQGYQPPRDVDHAGRLAGRGEQRDGDDHRRPVGRGEGRRRGLHRRPRQHGAGR